MTRSARHVRSRRLLKISHGACRKEVVDQNTVCRYAKVIIRSPYCLLIEFSFPPSSYHVIAMYEHDQFIFPSAMRFAHSAAVHSHPHCQHTCLITVPTSSSVTAVFPSMAPPDPGLAAIFFIRLREKRPRGPARFNPESTVRTSAFVISIIS